MNDNQPAGMTPPDDRDDFHGETSRSRPVAFWIFAFILASLVVANVLVWQRAGKSNHRAIGKPTPDFDLIRLSSQMSLDAVKSPAPGEVVLLHFWGTWCPPCRMEYPHLAQMTEGVKNPRFRFVPVSCGNSDDETLDSLWATTTSYFVDQRIVSPAFADPRGYTQSSTANRLGQASLYFPTSILIDTEGKIAGVWEGYTPDAVDEIQLAIASLAR